jgi:outer membrane biosynthesis protein TonB
MNGYNARKSYGIAELVGMFAKLASPIIQAVTDEMVSRRNITATLTVTIDPVPTTPETPSATPEVVVTTAPLVSPPATPAVALDTPAPTTVTKSAPARKPAPKKTSSKPTAPAKPKTVAKPKVMATAARSTAKPAKHTVKPKTASAKKPASTIGSNPGDSAAVLSRLPRKAGRS